MEEFYPNATTMKVLLIEHDKTKADVVLNALDPSQYQVTHITSGGVSLLRQVEMTRPALIIMDIESPDRDVIKNLHQISKLNPKPVVMLSDKSDKETITSLVKSGVSAYVMGDVSVERIKSITSFRWLSPCTLIVRTSTKMDLYKQLTS